MVPFANKKVERHYPWGRGAANLIRFKEAQALKHSRRSFVVLGMDGVVMFFPGVMTVYGCKLNESGRPGLAFGTQFLETRMTSGYDYLRSKGFCEGPVCIKSKILKSVFAALKS